MQAMSSSHSLREIGPESARGREPNSALDVFSFESTGNQASCELAVLTACSIYWKINVLTAQSLLGIFLVVREPASQ